MSEVIVVGGGGHAKVVLSIIRKLKRYEVLGYTALTDNGRILGAIYLGRDQALALMKVGPDRLVAALAVGQVGTGEKRQELWTQIRSLSIEFPVFVSPDAIVNESTTVGEASVVMDGAVINCGAVIGRGAIINTNCTVEHDVVIDDWVHVASGATISGGVRVGQFSMVGAGATVIENVRIAEGCMIGAGATVVDDLNEPGVYVGCPARRIK